MTKFTPAAKSGRGGTGEGCRRSQIEMLSIIGTVISSETQSQCRELLPK